MSSIQWDSELPANSGNFQVIDCKKIQFSKSSPHREYLALDIRVGSRRGGSGSRHGVPVFDTGVHGSHHGGRSVFQPRGENWYGMISISPSLLLFGPNFSQFQFLL